MNLVREDGTPATDFRSPMRHRYVSSQVWSGDQQKWGLFQALTLGTKMLRQWMAFFASLIVMDVHSPRNGVVGRLTVLSKPSDQAIIGTQVSQFQTLKALRLMRASLKTSCRMEESAPENA